MFTETQFQALTIARLTLWTLHTETTVILRDQAHLWPGNYKVTLEVMDQQGKSCADAQVLDVLVCTCLEDTKSCVALETSTKFGVSGVLLLLLGLLLLLCEYMGCTLRVHGLYLLEWTLITICMQIPSAHTNAAK